MTKISYKRGLFLLIPTTRNTRCSVTLHFNNIKHDKEIAKLLVLRHIYASTDKLVS